MQMSVVAGPGNVKQLQKTLEKSSFATTRLIALDMGADETLDSGTPNDLNERGSRLVQG
jgi:hypothetical protein